MTRLLGALPGGKLAESMSQGSGGEESEDADIPTDVELITDQGASSETGDLDRVTGESDGLDQIKDPLIEPEIRARESRDGRENQRRVAGDPEAGDVIGDYELLQKLGKGGAGSVFRARKRSGGPIVAIKVLSQSKTKRARVVQRFFDEVRAASAVMHPGLIRIIDFIEEEDPRRLAYVMEHVDGETLRERLKRENALDLREAIHIAGEVCDALAALHDAGIIHRDLKPENIMLLRLLSGGMPRVKLLDFGVVKFLPVDKAGAQVPAIGEERPGTFVGTPRYMAPEQAAGGVIDARADLFAVGVLLFEMITGRCPHEGDSLRDVVLAKLKGAPRITVNPEKEILPQELTDVVDSCLQLKPALRPKDARVVAAALRDAIVVLFAVGPIKADESGALFRPSSQVRDREHEVQVSAAQPGQHHGPQVHVSQASPRADTHSRPELPVPTAPPPAPAPPPAAVPPKLQAPPRKRTSRNAQRLIVVIGVLAVLVLILAFFAVRARDDQVLLVPLEKPDQRKAKPSTDRPYQVLVESQPQGAIIRVGGEQQGWTPKKVTIPKGTETVEVELSRSGYVDRAVTISRETPVEISVALEERRPATSTVTEGGAQIVMPRPTAHPVKTSTAP